MSLLQSKLIVTSRLLQSQKGSGAHCLDYMHTHNHKNNSYQTVKTRRKVQIEGSDM